MKSEMIDRLTEDVGGENNAYTNDDVTVYHEIIPSNHLERLLWAEAERMSNLNVDDANFKSEREVVKEEFRQSVLAPPYGRLFYLIDQKSFVAHPYRRPTIGSIEDLDAASVENVRAFHSTFYRPDNATLVVVGDFDQDQLDAWTDKYFAPIPKPAGTPPRVTVKEPARTRETRLTETGRNVPLPAVAFTFLIPPKSSADADALRVAETILGEGESSRLHRSLVYEQQIAQTVYARADLREDAGLFAFLAIAAGGKSPAEVGAAISAEIKKLQDAPPTAAEVEKAKNQLLARQFQERETNNGKAGALGDAAVLLGDVGRVNTDLERLARVTADDVRRVMKQYTAETNRLVIDYVPEANPDESKPDSGQPGPTGAK
jgi:zinc protease